MDLLLRNSGTTVFLPSSPRFRLIDSPVLYGEGQISFDSRCTRFLLLLLFFFFFDILFHLLLIFLLISRIITIIVTFVYEESQDGFRSCNFFDYRINRLYGIAISPQLGIVFVYTHRYRRVDTLLTGNPSGVLCQLA